MLRWHSESGSFSETRVIPPERIDDKPAPGPSPSVLANLSKCKAAGPGMLWCMEHCLLAGALPPDAPGGLLPV